MLHHIKILGILFVARGILSAMGGLLILLLFSSGGFGIPGLGNMTILIFIMRAIAIFIIIRGIPEIICGAGLLSRMKWSRIFGIIMSIVDILSVPIGTALGIYGLWVLFKPETEQLLNL